MKRQLTAIVLTAALAAPSLGQAGQGVMNMDRNEILGSVIGASVGALLGSEVGDGDNELIGAALGGVGGYFVGNRYSERQYRSGRRSFDQRRHGNNHRRHDDRRYERQSHRHSSARHSQGRQPRIHQIDQPFRARVDSHVRNGPAPGYRSVDVVRRGSRVHVAGRVAGTNWYMVSRRGRVRGYVYAPLLDPLHPYSSHRRYR